MKRSVIIMGLLYVVFSGCTSTQEKETAISEVPHVVAADPVQAGRYLVIIGQCNDCHTDGYMETEVQEEDWLTGSSVGWQGPWGTTYPPNLRLRAQEWSEDFWVQTLKTRKALPPMPWMNVNKYSEQDMRAIYAYIKSLGPKGEHAALAVAPGVMPSTPYLVMTPQSPPTTAVTE